jgi:hypothetical protein
VIQEKSNHKLWRSLWWKQTLQYNFVCKGEYLFCPVSTWLGRIN